MKELFEKAFERFSTTFLSYYNLWAYLDRTAKRLLSGQNSHTVTTCLEFYKALYSGRIKPGDRVILKNFFVTDWIPRCPGGIAHFVSESGLSDEDFRYLKIHHKSPPDSGLPSGIQKHPRVITMDYLREFGFSDNQYFSLSNEFNPTTHRLKSGALVPPHGCLRFPLAEKRPKLLGAVTAQEYNADFGIVLSVSDSVYSEFLSNQIENYAVEASLESYLDVFAPVRGSSINDDNVHQAFGTGLALSCPRYTLRIDSPLQVKFRTHNSHPQFNSWFIRRRTYVREPMTGFTVHTREDGTRYIEEHYGNLVEYEFVHYPILTNTKEELLEVRRILDKEFLGISAREFDSESIEHIRRFIRDYKSDKKKEDYLIDKVEHLTEFDGKWEILNPLVSFRSDPRGSKDLLRYANEIKGLEELL